MAVGDLKQTVLELLTEVYAGPPDPSSTWFIDNEPDSGVLGVISGVTAAEASWSPSGDRKPGTTVASHVEHLRWSLANARAELRGSDLGSWSQSWEVQQVDDAAWERLRQALRTEYTGLMGEIRGAGELPQDLDLSGLLALVPHAAYHLGNIRQMIERAREAAGGGMDGR